MLALSAPQYIFGSPDGIPAGRSPPECQTPCMDRPMRPCALCPESNLLRNFGGDASRTDRQAEWQTNSELDIPIAKLPWRR